MSTPPPAGSPAFAAPYRVPAPGTLSPSPAARRSRAVGIAAAAIAALALCAAMIVNVLAGARFGASGAVADLLGSGGDLRALSPVRGWVLVVEIVFWSAAALWTAAIALGIVAVVGRRGRALGVAAIVTAALGPVVALAAGSAALAVTG